MRTKKVMRDEKGTERMNIDPHSGVPMERSAYEALISTPQPYSYIWRDGMLYAMPGGSTVHSELADRLGELLRAGFGGWRSPCRALRDKYVEIPRHASLLPDLVVT